MVENWFMRHIEYSKEFGPLGFVHVAIKCFYIRVYVGTGIVQQIERRLIDPIASGLQFFGAIDCVKTKYWRRNLIKFTIQIHEDFDVLSQICLDL